MSTFPSFPVLPAELQLSIWELALPDPRIIHITNINPEVFATTELYKSLNSRNQLPGLLTACRTSRAAFQQHREKLHKTSSHHHDKLTYFDPLRDTLYLDVTWNFYSSSKSIPTHLSLLFSNLVLNSLRHLAAENTPWSVNCTFCTASLLQLSRELSCIRKK